jgi:ABC-type spermidine/putrescine transport system permease subunit I
MKKHIVALAAIFVFLAVFIPLTSTNPDGLDKVVQSFGASEGNSTWEGLMPNYTVSFVGNSYFSTLVAGIVGAVIVFVSALLIGKAFRPKIEKSGQSNSGKSLGAN